MPFGRYHDIPRTNPGGRVNPRFRPKGPPSSLAQLRAVVWTNCTRDTRPEGEVHSPYMVRNAPTETPRPGLNQLAPICDFGCRCARDRATLDFFSAAASRLLAQFPV